MDPQLAAIYGTNTDGDDIEKLAASELADDLAEEGEIDTDELTDEQAEALAQQVLEGADGEEEMEAEGEEGEEVEEPAEDEEIEKVSEAQEKLAEADYLGRVMAHSYTQELRKIAAAAEMEKDAGERWEKMKGKAREFGGKAKAKAQAGWAKAKEHGGKAVAHVKAHPKSYAAGAVGAAAAGAGAAYYKHKKKHSSAIDTLAERRALEILEQNGLLEEKTSASETEQEQLANLVEQRAHEILVANGYVQSDE
jgi:hypothetical protein